MNGSGGLETGLSLNSSGLPSPPYYDDRETILLPSQQLNYSGLLFISIPTITILGNLLVIISVLRFKALQSAINFLILGLAVADLLVALFVMPYAVYVYIRNGEWYLGNLMCDIYMASDVACSTASILLLAVISFDRYRAVSRPIQYSRQSMNIKRVFILIILIWVISLLLASPIVFGVNVRPPDASESECRFYNAEFSIVSSMISFIIPCFIVLFVYIRIILALKKREKAARLRREKNGLSTQTGSSGQNMSSEEGDEAGRIVAGPEEREFGNSSTPRSSIDDSLSEVIHVVTNDFISENCPSLSRQSSCNVDDANSADFCQDSKKAKKFKKLSRNYSSKHRKPGPKTHRSESDAFLPAVFRSISRRSPKLFRKEKAVIDKDTNTFQLVLSNPSPNTPAENRRLSIENPHKKNKKQVTVERQATVQTETQTETETLSASQNVANQSVSRSTTANSAELLTSPDGILIQQPPGHSTIYENDIQTGDEQQPSVHFNLTVRERGRSPGSTHERTLKESVERSTRRSTITNTDEAPLAMKILTRPSLPSNMNDVCVSPVNGVRNECGAVAAARVSSSSGHHPIVARSSSAGTTRPVPSSSFIARAGGSSATSAPQTIPSSGPGTRRSPAIISGSPIVHRRCVSSAVGSPSSSSSTQPVNATSISSPVNAVPPRNKIVQAAQDMTRQQIGRMDSIDSSSNSKKSRANSVKSIDSKQSLRKPPGAKTSDNSTGKNGGGRVPGKLGKKKTEQSLKRKVSKSQRKEKRATKTLGVVVGVFLICWVPFFTINILNAVCIIANQEWCQVSFDLFFYCTWIGYMNSFMNPVIYTIFNTEFRRAFKSILFGRKSTRGPYNPAIGNKANV